MARAKIHRRDDRTSVPKRFGDGFFHAHIKKTNRPLNHAVNAVAVRTEPELVQMIRFGGCSVWMRAPGGHAALVTAEAITVTEAAPYWIGAFAAEILAEAKRRTEAEEAGDGAGVSAAAKAIDTLVDGMAAELAQLPGRIGEKLAAKLLGGKA